MLCFFLAENSNFGPPQRPHSAAAFLLALSLWERLREKKLGANDETWLGGGFKYFFIFQPEPWGNDSSWLIFFKWVENHQLDDEANDWDFSVAWWFFFTDSIPWNSSPWKTTFWENMFGTFFEASNTRKSKMKIVKLYLFPAGQDWKTGREGFCFSKFWVFAWCDRQGMMSGWNPPPEMLTNRWGAPQNHLHPKTEARFGIHLPRPIIFGISSWKMFGGCVMEEI